LDNGSTDNTIELARRRENATIYTSTLPIEAKQASLKRHMAENMVSGGWCLDADIDEFFDYPFSDDLGLPLFLGYLRSKRNTSVLTQMLDLFGDRPLASLAEKRKEEELVETYRYYDISEARKSPYLTSALTVRHASNNQTANPMSTL